METHEIVMLPSASTLAALRRRQILGAYQGNDVVPPLRTAFRVPLGELIRAGISEFDPVFR